MMPQSSARMRAVLPVAKQKAISAGTSPSEDSSDTMRRMPSGCTPEPAGASVPRMTRCEIAHLARGAQREQRRALVAVVNQLEAALAALADAADLVVGQRGVAAIDVADHVGVGFQHHVLVDQAGAGDRGAAGVDRALDAVFARPAHHLARGRAVLDAAEADFAEQLDAGRGELLEIVLDHFAFDHGRAGMHLHAARTQRPERALREDRHRLQADDVARAGRACAPRRRRSWW